MRILAVCGSLQAKSRNLVLLDTAADPARTHPGVEVVRSDALRTLPLFNPDLELDGPLPAVVAWRASIAASEPTLSSGRRAIRSRTSRSATNGRSWPATVGYAGHGSHQPEP